MGHPILISATGQWLAIACKCAILYGEYLTGNELTSSLIFCHRWTDRKQRIGAHHAISTGGLKKHV